MEVKFQKTAISCLQTHMQRTQTQEQTQQVRLPETLPDVGRVLAGWGQVLLRGKEWHSDSVSVSGGVKTWVLYEPEDGTAVRCVESWLPFQMKWDMPEADRDGTLILCPGRPKVDARMLSDRKLMVRAGICMEARAMILSDCELYTPEDVPQDVQLLQNTYSMLLPTEAGENAFQIEQNIAIPSGEQPIRTLLRYTLSPTLTESKIVADKLVYRGYGEVHLLYIGTDERLHSWSTQVPFSQYTQLEEQYDSGGEVQVCFAVTELEAELGEDGSVMLKAGITAQYVLYDRKWITVVEDMYSPNRSVKPQLSQLQLPSVLDVQTHTVRAEGMPDPVPAQLLDAVFYGDPPYLQAENDQVRAELSGEFLMLGVDDEGAYCVANCRWDDTWIIPASQDAEVSVRVENIGIPQNTGSGMKTEVSLQAVTEARKPIYTVTGAELGELTEPDPERPSLILCRAREESLWELAKRCGSTVEAIQKLNALQQEPDPNQLLLIPVI